MSYASEYRYPEWFNKKMFDFYTKKLEQLKRLRVVHQESAAYYSRLHIKIYAPSIIITGLSGVASFLSSSSVFNESTQTGLAIGVGVLASASTMIQSFASAVDYSTKAKMHREASEDYDKLITKVEFEMEMPNEEDFLDNLESTILDIQNKCTYAPPKHIVEAYDAKAAKAALIDTLPLIRRYSETTPLLTSTPAATVIDMIDDDTSVNEITINYGDASVV